jgi:pumilio RNA-binding family
MELRERKKTHVSCRNYFLQRAIEYGGERLQVDIAKRIAADVVSLSLDQFGSYVVESCFLQIMRSTMAPLQLVLDAFLALGDDDLAELVQGSFSNYVVSKLLRVAKDVSHIVVAVTR